MNNVCPWKLHNSQCTTGIRQFSLRKHAYSNIYKISPKKTEKIQIKKIWYFCSKRWLWVPTSYVFEQTSQKHAYINLTPLQPHFYIVKLGFTGVYIIFLILLNNIDCGYSLEPPRRGGSNVYHNLCFEQKYEKYESFYMHFFPIFWRWNFLYIWIGVFS